METSLKTGFAQIFSCCPKNLSCPDFGGGCSPPRPPGQYAYAEWTVMRMNRFSQYSIWKVMLAFYTRNTCTCFLLTRHRK